MSKTYTTIQGDQWDHIAYKLYGTEAGVNALLEANHQYACYVVFPAGIELRVPELEEKQNLPLPPWKR